MPNTKTGTTWAPDIRPESIETFIESYTPEGGEEQTLTYKRVADHPILNGIRDIKAFFTTHAGAVWYNLAERKTLLTKLDEMDANIEMSNTNYTALLNRVAAVERTQGNYATSQNGTFRSSAAITTSGGGKFLITFPKSFTKVPTNVSVSGTYVALTDGKTYPIERIVVNDKTASAVTVTAYPALGSKSVAINWSASV